jgi:hypothetical protein
MISGVLQDWTTQRAYNGGNGSIVSITQAESGYLDLAEYDDLVVYLDVREFTTGATMSISYQTAVSSDDASFVAGALAMVAPFALSVTTTPVVNRILAAYAPVPLARYVRWQLTTTVVGIWDVCFRITYAAYAPGA